MVMAEAFRGWQTQRTKRKLLELFSKAEGRPADREGASKDKVVS